MTTDMRTVEELKTEVAATHLPERSKEAFYQALGNQVLDIGIGYWSLVIGHWALGIGYWVQQMQDHCQNKRSLSIVKTSAASQ